MSPIKVVIVAFIAFTVTFALFYVILFMSDTQSPFEQNNFRDTTMNPQTLSPARKLAGTWKTSFPVEFYIRTDFETGELVDIGSEDRTMSWVITATNSENVVSIEVSFVASNQQLSGFGYTPDVSPMYFTGTISGTKLTLITDDRTVGTFSFTTDIITGTWDDRWSMAYGQEVYTTINSLVLTRQ
ncbi:MAG TPA: hypothetical protein VK209_02805 [Candidatus Sulfotelmatobacter sp.]|nr:hypothetical protein [Candidatus Sulfotelmatobacter sp.]